MSWLLFGVCSDPERPAYSRYAKRGLLVALRPEGFLDGGRVADESGLKGKYDYNLEFGGGGLIGSALPSPAPDGPTDSGSDLFTALEKQLGLKLEKTKTPLDVVVIDSIEKLPAGN